MLRTFTLYRAVDESGVSGTGPVALGAVWPDGHVALRWLTKHRSTSVYDSIEAVEHIHGHGGKTEIQWNDEEPLCTQCLGGSSPIDCFDCGAGRSNVMLPKWAADAIRKKDRQRIRSAEETRAQRDALAQKLDIARQRIADLEGAFRVFGLAIPGVP